MTVLTDAALEAAMATRPARRVTEGSIKDRIASVRYFYDGTLTIAVLTMYNGFKVVGKSAAAAPENYDKDIGETYAFKDAFNQVWALEGYVLRSELFAEEGAPT